MGEQAQPEENQADYTSGSSSNSNGDNTIPQQREEIDEIDESSLTGAERDLLNQMEKDALR